MVLMVMVRKHREGLARRRREVSCPGLIYDWWAGTVMKPQWTPDIIPQMFPMLLSKRETTNHPISDGFLCRNYKVLSATYNRDFNLFTH